MGAICCRDRGRAALIKDRPLIHFIDLSLFGSHLRLSWKKHRMSCAIPRFAGRTGYSEITGSIFRFPGHEIPVDYPQGMTTRSLLR